MASTASSSVNAFQRVDKSKAAVYENRNGQVSFVAATLPAFVSQSWIPSVDNTYDLGENSTPKRWRDLWLSRNLAVVGAISGGSATITGNLVSAGTLLVGANGLRQYNNAVPDIGTSGARFGTGYFTALNSSGTLTAGAATVSSLTVTSTTPSSFGGIIMPGSSSAYDIGTSGIPWKDLYISGNIYKGGVLYNPGLGALGDLLPSADNTYVIGKSPSQRWKTAYFSGLVQTDGGFTAAGDFISVSGNVTAANGTVSAASISGATGIFSNYVNPLNDTFADCGGPAKRWGNVWGLVGHFNTVIPNAAGTPAAASTVGSSTNVYQYGYIDNISSQAVVPRVAAGSAVGASGNRFANGYFTNLDVSGSLTLAALPTSSFLTSTESASANIANILIGVTSVTLASGSGTWYIVRLGPYYVASVTLTCLPAVGAPWGNTGPLDIRFDLQDPLAGNWDVAGIGGVPAITFKQPGTSQSLTYPGQLADTGTGYVRFYFFNLPYAPRNAEGAFGVSCTFMCKRVAA